MRILIVEDDVDAGTALALLLRAQGHETVYARTGEEALLRRIDWKPDVVLLDLRLPGLAGLDFLYQFRSVADQEGLPHTPVIFVTGAPPLQAVSAKLDAEKEALGPVAGILIKPVDLDQLNKLLAKVKP